MPLEIDTIDNQDFSIIANVKDSGVLLTDPLEFPVNNSLGYSAVAGAVMYINPKTRTNRQGNRECMINEVDGTQIEAIKRSVCLPDQALISITVRLEKRVPGPARHLK